MITWEAHYQDGRVVTQYDPATLAERSTHTLPRHGLRLFKMVRDDADILAMHLHPGQSIFWRRRTVQRDTGEILGVCYILGWIKDGLKYAAFVHENTGLVEFSHFQPTEWLHDVEHLPADFELIS